MATIVFERWGIRSAGDFGEIVFNLIDAELLSRRPCDSRLDFVDGIDFRDAFDEKHRESLQRIAERFLSGTDDDLTNEELGYLDRVGNGDGRYDLGDLSLYVRDHPTVAARARASGGIP